MKKKLTLLFGALAVALSSLAFSAKAAPAQKQGPCPLCCAQGQCTQQVCGCNK